METDCFVKVAVEEALRGCGGGRDMEADCEGALQRPLLTKPLEVVVLGSP